MWGVDPLADHDMDPRVCPVIGYTKLPLDSTGAGQAPWPGRILQEIGTTGPLMLVGFGASHCPQDGLAAPLRMFRHTTVWLQRNKFYLIYIYNITAEIRTHKFGSC